MLSIFVDYVYYLLNTYVFPIIKHAISILDNIPIKTLDIKLYNSTCKELFKSNSCFFHLILIKVNL